MTETFDHRKSIDYFQQADQLYAHSAKLKWLDLTVASASGSLVQDIDGNEYIDLHGNGSCANIGHSHPKVVAAIKNQADRLVHYCPGYFYHDQMVDSMQALIDTTPGDFDKKLVYGNSGSDANDGMIKYMRAYTGRKVIISFDGAYHGTSYGALSLSTCAGSMRRGVNPLLTDIYQLPFPDYYHRSFDGESEADFVARYIAQAEDKINRFIPLDEVAGFIIEPIQGDSGIIKPPAAYMAWLKQLCHDHDLLIGVDEVNQGLGRSGRMWSIEHFDIVPDLLATAKSLANGLPLSAVVGRAEVIDSVNPPAHLFTTAGNPICCAASQAVLQVIEEEGLVDRSHQLGLFAKDRLNLMKDRFQVIGDVRMYGLNGAIELVKDRQSKEAARLETLKIMKYCHDHGVILITLSSNVLRFQPPLNIEKNLLERALDVVEDAFEALEAGAIDLDATGHLGW